MGRARELAELAASYDSGNIFGMKNRIINGAMVIDQRNNGASVTPATSQYTLDRWFASRSQASKYSVQQNAGSVTPPAGFRNYLGVTSTSAYSVLSTDFFYINQFVEVSNAYDLNWGTANAQPVTLSFWVRSSLTGTFGGSIYEYNNGYPSYPFSFTISSANTWEYKTVVIPGPISGTWSSTINTGLFAVSFSLGMGSNYSGTANSWANSNFYIAPTGATSVVGTNGATFYITGVQLEKGSTATSFDYRPYGTELALCQRYYYRCATRSMGLAINASTLYNLSLAFPVTMRSSPTLDASGNSFEVQTGSAGTVGIYNLAGLRTTADAACVHNNGGNNWTTNTGVCISAGFSAEL